MKRKLTARQRRIVDPIRETDIAPFPVKKFAVKEYRKMLQVGIFRSGDPYELLEGWIVPKLRRSPPNASTCAKLQRRLIRAFDDDSGGWIYGYRVIACRTSEPEPVATLTTGPLGKYEKRFPKPAEVGLVIEVSDDSLERDRGIKQRIYARERIPTYWIVNVVGRAVEVYTDPRGGKNPTYKTRTDYAAGRSVPVVLSGKMVGDIAVSDILPGGN